MTPEHPQPALEPSKVDENRRDSLDGYRDQRDSGKGGRYDIRTGKRLPPDPVQEPEAL
jgi:hypothetical protein